jgi:hypothetical protein
LFADKDDFRAPRTFAEHGLSASFPKIATFAVGGGFAKSFQAFALREKIFGGIFRFVFTHTIDSAVLNLVQT